MFLNYFMIFAKNAGEFLNCGGYSEALTYMAEKSEGQKQAVNRQNTAKNRPPGQAGRSVLCKR
jgi:hypothetical protein